MVGFTGTRQGLTRDQRQALMELLEGAIEAHHGDCIGADAEFHQLALLAGVPIVIHPPEDNKQRAFCVGENVTMRRPKPYLVRNRDIVLAATIVAATPKESVEPKPGRGQGTWSTIRFARKIGRELRVIWP